MSQVHSAGSNLRQGRSENGTLPMCEKEEMETKVPGEKEARGNSSRDSKASAKGRKAGQGRKRDPNLDNEAVRKYRDIIHLQANWLQREFIANEVEDSPRGLRIWEATLVEHMGHGWNPKDVLMMLKNYKVIMDNVRAGLSGNGHR